MLQKNSNKLCSFKLSINQRFQKIKYHVSTKIASKTIVFNIDNNKKCFLSSILEWFLKDHVTLKTNLLWITEIKYILQYVQL